MYIKQITGIIGSFVSLEEMSLKLKVERHSVCCELGCRLGVHFVPDSVSRLTQGGTMV